MNYKRLKAACYMSSASMAAVGNLSPLLFLTFRTLYGISYSMLGLLVLINFCTQLCVDLIFSFFSKRFNIPLTLKITPLLTVTGLLVYSASPILFSGNVYAGLVVGTVIFSAASGLSEVLTSPTIAAIPSEKPDREMSKLHSVYAWAVVFVVLFSTVFLKLAGQGSWQWLSVIFSAIPIMSFVLFWGCKIPVLQSDAAGNHGGTLGRALKSGVLIFVLCIFLGGAAECVMSQWSSSYIERALGIPKLWGDILGVAMFAAALGLGRTLYTKFGKNIGRVMLLGSVGAVICYIIAALSGVAVLGLVACALTGFCVSMLWPGSLILVSDGIHGCGVTVFALMAAGGDLGAAVGPQLIGVLTDTLIENTYATSVAANLGIGVEELAMKASMLAGAVFPLAGAVVVSILIHRIKQVSKITGNTVIK